VIALHQERSEEALKKLLIGLVDLLSDRVGDSTQTRGGSVSRFPECQRHLRG